MTMTKRLCDPLGRSAPAAPRIALALCVAATISGSAWPIQARSVRPSVDTTLLTDPHEANAITRMPVRTHADSVGS